MKKTYWFVAVLSLFALIGVVVLSLKPDTHSVKTNVLESGVLSVAPTSAPTSMAVPTPTATQSAKEVYDAEHSLPDALAVSLDASDEVLGDDQAPITLIEFSDYQCPFCQNFYENTLPHIKENYIDTGKVKFVYKDLPLPAHKAALPAAFATRCAAEQGKFWEMHDAIFSHADEWLGASNPFVFYREYAQDIGLSMSTYEYCVSNQEVFGEIESDITLAQIYGVQSTPTFLINGYLVPGAQSYEVFAEIFDTLLAENQ